MIWWLSKHFMATDVSATGRLSFRQVTLPLLGTGTVVVCLQQVGITDWVRKRLKMSVKTLDSQSAHALSTCHGNLSGPAALWMLTWLKVLLTSAAESVTVIRTAHALMHVSVLLASKWSYNIISSSGRLVSLGSSRLCPATSNEYRCRCRTIRSQSCIDALPVWWFVRGHSGISYKLPGYSPTS